MERIIPAWRGPDGKPIYCTPRFCEADVQPDRGAYGASLSLARLHGAARPISADTAGP